MLELNFLKVEILIITALPEELAAVDSVMSRYQKKPEFAPYNQFSPKYYKVKHYRIVAFTINEMGRVAAALATSNAIEIWKPKVVLLVGIIGGVRKYVARGDIIIPQHIYDYELCKMTRERKPPRNKKNVRSPKGTVRKTSKRQKREWRGEKFDADPELCRQISEIDVKSIEKLLLMKRPPKKDRGDKMELRLQHPPSKLVASGDKSIAVKRMVKELEAESKGSIIGIEMEGGGFCKAVKISKVRPDWLMIKAVSDYADESEGDKTTKSWRKYALKAAASATRILIEMIAKKQSIALNRADEEAPLHSLINSGRVTDVVRKGNMLVCLCDFQTYEEFAESMSSGPTDLVLWFQNGSPLNVNKNELTKMLSKPDRIFRKIRSEKKLRVVIFEDIGAVRKYCRAREEQKLRCGAFEKSCKSLNGRLWFTCRELLDKRFELPADFQYDFGFVAKPGNRARNAGYCFHSPFVNNASKQEKSHVTVFDSQTINQVYLKFAGTNLMKYGVILDSMSGYPLIVNYIGECLYNSPDPSKREDITFFEKAEHLYQSLKLKEKTK